MIVKELRDELIRLCNDPETAESEVLVTVTDSKLGNEVAGGTCDGITDTGEAILVIGHEREES